MGEFDKSGGLLKPQEAADFLGIKLSTIYAMCMRRQIPVVKLGRLNRFRRQDLDKWIEGHLQESRP